jgi:mannose-1-phosphate guanylyltransferase
MLLPVIIAGGSGSRLWPLSRSARPKQFLPLYGEISLFQAALQRAALVTNTPATVICNEEHRFLVAEQIRESGAELGSLLLEPVGRNTAPAIALAALDALAKGKDPLLLVLAADHVIANQTAFVHAVETAIPLAESAKFMVFGITPDSPETGYGYVKAATETGLSAVEQFVEKPDLSTAEQYLASGGFYWNSGMFLFRASRYLQELGKFRPDILTACEKAISHAVVDLDFIRIGSEAFTDCPEDSIDYAVMEPLSVASGARGSGAGADAPVWLVPLDAGWNDVGSWSALWDIGAKDEHGNVCHGDVVLEESSGCYLHSNHRLLATIGVSNLVVIDTRDAVLVADKSAVQDVRKIVAHLKRSHRQEHNVHREVYRPWGKYDSVDSGVRYQVKRITVKPGEKLSRQMHHHRAEHWVVVSGTARVFRGDEILLLSENQSVYIPIGEVHSLENPGKIPLELIEVQSGAYLGEDDIVRFEDRYGRA